MRYEYCRKDFGIKDYCIWMPVPILLDMPFKKLSVSSCLLYAFLLHMQTASGMTDKNGRRCIVCAREGLMTILRCKKEELEASLAELSAKECGLIKTASLSEKKLLVYVKNYSKPILPPAARRRCGYTTVDY